MGFKNGKEWRVARKDPLVKNAAKEHEAFEYIKQDTEKLWSEVQSKQPHFMNGLLSIDLSHHGAPLPNDIFDTFSFLYAKSKVA